MKPDRESASLLAEVLADEPDFASEHCDFTVGDHERGGPEGLPEPESPKGYGGADIHRSHRSRRPRPDRKAVVMALQEPHPATSSPAPARVVATAPVASPAPATPAARVVATAPVAPPRVIATAPVAPPASAAPPASTAPPAATVPPAETAPPPEPEPDFALEHRHLTVGGADVYRTRRH